MIRKRPTRKTDSRIRVIANQRIRAQEVRVISSEGTQAGVMSLAEAINLAKSQDKDLVLINSNSTPVVTKIIDIAKFKYQQQQKAAESRKKSKSQEVKTLRFTPFMGEGDFQSRLKKVVTFLTKGDKVKLTLEFRGRAITKQEFGFELFDRIINETQHIASVDMEPKMVGKKLIAQLVPDKKK